MTDILYRLFAKKTSVQYTLEDIELNLYSIIQFIISIILITFVFIITKGSILIVFGIFMIFDNKTNSINRIANSSIRLSIFKRILEKELGSREGVYINNVYTPIKIKEFSIVNNMDYNGERIMIEVSNELKHIYNIPNNLSAIKMFLHEVTHVKQLIRYNGNLPVDYDIDLLYAKDKQTIKDYFNSEIEKEAYIESFKLQFKYLKYVRGRV